MPSTLGGIWGNLATELNHEVNPLLNLCRILQLLDVLGSKLVKVTGGYELQKPYLGENPSRREVRLYPGQTLEVSLLVLRATNFL